MSANLHNAFNNLIGTVLELYLYTVLLRIVLHAVRADFYNPISQLVWQFTQPVVRPVQIVVPSWRRFDLAAALVLYVLSIIYIEIMALLWGQTIGLGAAVFYAALEIFVLVLNLYMFSLFVYAILSWVGPGMNNPTGSILWSLNEPLLRPVRRALPPVSGLDFSPLVVMLLLLFVRRLILLPGFF